MKSSQSEKAQVKPKGPVYFSPTQKDFMNAASRLSPTAKPFLPSRQLNPRALEFSPRSFVEVRSLDCVGVKARIPVDPVSPMISLVDLEKYFPRAKGLFFFSNEKSGEKRLISVIRSCSLSDEKKQTLKIGDTKFLLPEGLDRIFYVTQKFLETEDCSQTAEMIQQVGAMMSLLERSLGHLSELQDRLKTWDQISSDRLDESGCVDCYHQDYDRRGGESPLSVAEYKKENY